MIKSKITYKEEEFTSCVLKRVLLVTCLFIIIILLSSKEQSNVTELKRAPIDLT